MGAAIDEGSQPDAYHTPPILLHLSFKWDPSTEQTTHLTRYTWYPSLPIQEIAARIIRIYEGEGRDRTKRLAINLLEIVASKMSRDDLRYLEVTEEDNERCSFDLNCYDAELTLKDLSAFLRDMCQHFEVSRLEFDALYEVIRGSTLGHVAGGLHREGDEFFTIYYGVEGRHG